MAHLEPAFSTQGPAWQLAGFGAMPAEPEDPDFRIPSGALHWNGRDTAERASLAQASAELPAAVAEPLDAARTRPVERRRRWKAALAASCLLHLAAAAFLLAANRDLVMIEGSEEAGVMLLGNAPEDQSAAGDALDLPDVTQVTLVTMLDPKPVETVAATSVPVTEAVQPDQAEVAEAAVPVATPVEPAAEAPQAEPETATPVVEAAAPEPTDEAPPPAAIDPAPEILTARTLQPVENEDAAPLHVKPAAQQPDTPAEAAPVVESAEAVPAETAERVAAEEEKPKPVEKGPVEKKPVEKKTVAKAEKQKPVREPVEQAKPVKKAEKAPAKPARQKPRAGAGGSGETDARRGVAEGQVAGTNARASTGGAASAAGNAAVSNYPGKIAARLRRAVRGVSGLARSRARNDVHVSFVVDAGGGVGGIRIVRSSGSPELDQAALAVVRRAAPFPPIPPQAGRSSWAFTLPLGIAR